MTGRHSMFCHRQVGMTMIELLVAMAIGVGVVLAVSTLLVAGENHKRTTTSTNDADQAGSYAFYALDKALRSAGSAIVESAFPLDQGVIGCRLNVSSGGTAILPRTTPFPPPFATAFLSGATGNLRVAPLLIAKDQSDNAASDVLVVMSGSGSAGGVSRAINGAGSATSLVLETSTGFFTGDLALVSQSGVNDCLFEEIASITAPTLTVGGTTYYTTTATSTSLAALSGSTTTYVTPLGNAAANNVQFTLFGVGTNNTLYSYDLLQNQRLVQGSGGDTAEAITDGVVQMNAIYGVQTAAAPGILANWAGPGDAGYDIGTVMTTPATIESIIAVRVALVVRGEYYDKNVVSPPILTIFSGYVNAGGTSLAQTINLSTMPGNAQHYRYRIFEFTVPLRNMLLLAGA